MNGILREITGFFGSEQDFTGDNGIFTGVNGILRE